ncbi:hypothetical protein BD779DRAFT_1672560 [Infundibulicybe gibba]|nr:hypothetical protein BD779DRAFT_1672560 [Infundibulicybe gibba]
MQATNPDFRPLPDGWIQDYNPAYNTWYYVDLRCNPPTSTYQHPLDLVYPSPHPHPTSFPSAHDSPSPPNGNHYSQFPGGPNIGGNVPANTPQSPYASEKAFSPTPPVPSTAYGSQPLAPAGFFSMPDFPQPPAEQQPMPPTYSTPSMPYIPQSPLGQTPAQPPTYPISAMPGMPTSTEKSTSESSTYLSPPMTAMTPPTTNQPSFLPTTPAPTGHGTQPPANYAPGSVPTKQTGTPDSSERGFGKGGLRKSLKKYGGIALEAAVAQSGAVAGGFITNTLLSST